MVTKSMLSLQDVAPSTVRLMVVDNIILQPSLDVYILVGTKVIYKVKQLRRGQQKGNVFNSAYGNKCRLEETSGLEMVKWSMTRARSIGLLNAFVLYPVKILDYRL